MHCLTKSDVEKMKPADNDYVVVMGSHTRNYFGVQLKMAELKSCKNRLTFD